MMKRAALPIAALLLLTGCAAQPAAKPTPTVTADANAKACNAVADETTKMADELNNAANGLTAWAGVRHAFDAAGLEAHGDVKDRIETLVSNWPEVAAIVVYRNFDDFNTSLNDIARACEASGTTIHVATFTK